MAQTPVNVVRIFPNSIVAFVFHYYVICEAVIRKPDTLPASVENNNSTLSLTQNRLLVKCDCCFYLPELIALNLSTNLRFRIMEITFCVEHCVSYRCVVVLLQAKMGPINCCFVRINTKYVQQSDL